MLAASAVKSGGVALAKGSVALAATGSGLLQSLTVGGFTALALGKLLVRRGRGATLGAAFD